MPTSVVLLILYEIFDAKDVALNQYVVSPGSSYFMLWHWNYCLWVRNTIRAGVYVLLK